MPRSHQKLDALAAMLERTGDDPLRLDLVQRAQRFKRSWVELGEALTRLRDSRGFQAWGYGDLHEYCSKELSIKPATVDKLVLSFATVERHAPEVLSRDGVARNIPSLEAVDYFSRALGSEEHPGPFRRLDAPDDVVEQLRSAVFDEGQGVRELRERFNPVLHDKPERDERDELLHKARALTDKLAQLLPALSGLTEARVGRVIAALEALARDLDALQAAADKSAARRSQKRAREQGSARTRGQA
jgi:hypothetical protein